MFKFFLAFWSIIVINVFCSAWALNFMGDWRYLETKDEPETLFQVYSLTLSSQATNNLILGTTFRYNRTSQGDSYRETLTPVLSLSLRNDFFNFNVSATATEQHGTESRDLSSRSWNADLSSSYIKGINSRIYFGRSKQKDGATSHLINQKSDYWGLNLSKDFRNFDLYYDYRISHGENYVLKSTTNTYSHLVKLNYAGSFDKFYYSFGQQFNYTKTKWQAELIGGKADFPINISVEWYINNSLDSWDGKNLQDFDDGIIDDDYLIIDLGIEEIGLLEFYYDTVNWYAIPSSIKWDIYYSNDKITWSLLVSDVSLPFDFSGLGSLNFSKARYLKLVPKTFSDLKFNSPQFRAYKYITSSQYKTTFKTYRTSLALSYNFSENLISSYSFSLNRAEPSPGPDSKDYIHSVSISWIPNKFFQPTVSASKTKNIKDKQPDLIIDNLSFSVFSDILPTLDISYGYTHTNVKENDVKKVTNDNFNISTFAKIYPDLDFRWDISIGKSKNYENDLTSKTLSSRTNAIARLKPTITTTFTYQYDYSNNDLSSTTTHNFIFDLSWTISKNCSFHGSENIKFTEGETNINSFYSLWFSLTPRTQINFQYSGNRNGTDTDQFSGFLSWKISRYLSFKSNYTWLKTGDDTSWSWMVNLTAKF
ncbi:hypothetical protein Thein_1790 [Thermodesulfatator indicus DSM 15286]|uniref:Uncharacterized protein n=1 Tax=Thermodesulfatator indicus (strain DSM 15286 / JCM 11887 / CIR29812) TaxID=667014 RepID=F8ABV4_THEID|nr:hypothetical protein Thein_1790 [Thermodesulfatator indicus DSM 15286]